jgi:hypothetical protein
MSLTRRSFLKGSAASAALAMVGGTAVDSISAQTSTLANGPGNKWPGRVVINFNKNTATGVTVDETVAKKMVSDAICKLTGETEVATAWKAVFPSTLSASSKIAIKINILNNGNPAPHAFTVAAICEGLTSMDFAGTKFPASNITIYDMNNGNSMDSAGYTSARFPSGVKRVKDSKGTIAGALSETYASTLVSADFLINVFSPRGHWSEFGGFTLGFKSHYGTYDPVHGNSAPAYVRDINCTGPVFNKTVLSMCSGLFGMNEGNGPGGGKDDYSSYSKKMDATSTNNNPTTIIMSTDPVSCEMQSIKMMRMNNSKSFATADLPLYLKMSGGVTGSGSTIYNIGIIDENQMDVRKLINGVDVSPVVRKKSNVHDGISLHVNQVHNTAFIEYRLPVSFVEQHAIFTIIRADGSMVQSFSRSVSGVVEYFSWDRKDVSGTFVRSGMYLIKMQCGNISISSKFTLQ